MHRLTNSTLVVLSLHLEFAMPGGGMSLRGYFPPQYISNQPSLKEGNEKEPAGSGTLAPIRGKKWGGPKHNNKAPATESVVVKDEASEEWFESIDLRDDQKFRLPFKDLKIKKSYGYRGHLKHFN